MCFQQIFVVVLVLFSLSACQRLRKGKNACRNFADYKTFQTNPNCFYEPEIDMKVPELIMHYGYPFESHQLMTDDGFILNVFRVPHNGSNMNDKRQPVILQHGLAATSKSYLFLGQDSLVFMLARNGYDVWLPNARSSEYSQKHTKYTPNQRQYWDFSFHEMGVYDLPKILNFVRQQTGQKAVYIGHSMGTTMALIYASTFPEQAKNNLQSLILLAPVAFMGHVRGTSSIISPFANDIGLFLEAIGVYGIGANFGQQFQLLNRLCSETPLIYLCAASSLSFAGVNPEELRAPHLGYAIVRPQYSAKTMMHFAQLIKAKTKFQMFDYGRDKNLAMYQTEAPPEYPIENINIPVYLFYGKKDYLSTKEDVYYLYNKLNTEKDIKEEGELSHNDFIYGRSAPAHYSTLLSYLKTD